MATANQWKIVSIEPEPRMPDNINKEFRLVIVPGGKVTDVVSQRPAFAKVREFEVEADEKDRLEVRVKIHGMSAGTLNVPFVVKLEGGEVGFTIRVVG